MYSDSHIPEQCLALWQECQDLLSEIILSAPAKKTSLTLTSQSTLDFNHAQSLYLIKEGILKEYYNETLIINYEEGDLVGIQCLVNNNQTRTTTDFAVQVDEYDIVEFLKYVASDEKRLMKWHVYLANMIQSWQVLVGETAKGDVLFHPEIREYKAGEKIIEQGATDNEVYTLISGSAGVVVDGTQVGEIKCDEVFGAMAALTGTPRTADVIVKSDCTVLVVTSDRFQSLLVNRPETVAKLIEDMARMIVSSNEQIVDLSRRT